MPGFQRGSFRRPESDQVLSASFAHVVTLLPFVVTVNTYLPPPLKKHWGWVLAKLLRSCLRCDVAWSFRLQEKPRGPSWTAVRPHGRRRPMRQQLFLQAV